MPNFDINVFNYGAHNDEKDSWKLCPYTLVEAVEGISTAVEMYKYNLVLTEEDAFALGLGGDNDIWEDDDWIDKDTLIREFGLTDRILEWVYEVESVIDKELVT